MLTGLDILLARMKTNPEEFLEEERHVPYEGQQFGGKWADLLTYAWRIATEEERKMLEDAQRQFYRDDFNERVMKRLAGEESLEEKLAKKVVIKSSGRYATGWTDPAVMRNAIHGGFGQAQIKSEGQPADYLENYFNTTLLSNGSSNNADSNS